MPMATPAWSGGLVLLGLLLPLSQLAAQAPGVHPNPLDWRKPSEVFARTVATTG